MTMRAVQFLGDGVSRLVTVDPPSPGPGQVRVRLAGSGVCPSNLPVWEGRPWFSYPADPGAPGHEGWGVIDAIGADVDADLQGRQVSLLSSRSYAEWDVAAASQIAIVPDALRDRAIPGEPLACAVNVFRRCGITAGQTVVVVGVGFLGAVLVRLAARAGARVIGVSRRTSALRLAEDLGAAATLSLDGPEDPVAYVERVTGGRLADCVIEAVGLQRTLDLATMLTGVRGRLVVAGYHQDGRRSVDLQLWNWRGIDVINAHERDPALYVDGMRAAFDLLDEGTIDLAPLITHELPLEQLDVAFRLMTERPEGFVKAVVRMEGA